MKCQKCQTEHAHQCSYCKKCGAKLQLAPKADYEVAVNKTKVFFFVLLGYIAVINWVADDENYISVLVMDLIFAVIVIVFSFINFRTLKEVLIPKITNYKLLGILLFVMPLIAYGVSKLATIFNHNYTESTTYYDLYADAPFPLLICIISVAVFPAIFEEIAFRGIVYHDLNRIVSVDATLIITSLLFTILHCSFISFIWLFPIGYLFGYLRYKYNNLIYGILAHFIYNTCVVLIEYYRI